MAYQEHMNHGCSMEYDVAITLPVVGFKLRPRTNLQLSLVEDIENKMFHSSMEYIEGTESYLPKMCFVFVKVLNKCFYRIKLNL